MKRKVLLSLLALSLVLTFSMPVPALAAKPSSNFVDFSAGGAISYISAGDVAAAGDSGRWRVITRELDGTLAGSINGAYALTYKANVESTTTQAGNLHGTLAVGSYSIEVNGTIEPLVFVDWVLPPGIDPNYPYGIPILYLEINGNWTFVDGTQGNGDFTAGVWFIPDEYGHVYYIFPYSYFSMTGKWKQ